jgi:hypothetical protein
MAILFPDDVVIDGTGEGWAAMLGRTSPSHVSCLRSRSVVGITIEHQQAIPLSGRDESSWKVNCYLVQSIISRKKGGLDKVTT